MKSMHLFAGGGGGLLADLILGHEPIVAVEWDAYCCKILRERASDGWFTNLHVYEGDVRLFNPSEYKGRVDIIHAGFPCQDISQAGKQAGLGEGTRSGLYREVLRIAGVVRPKIIFMENVSAILSNGLGTVLADLAEMGYDARWCCIRASDVGAPHQRDRWWLRAELGNAEHNGHASTKIRSGFNERSDTKAKGQVKTSKFKGSSLEYEKLADTYNFGYLHSQPSINTTEGRLDAQRDTTSSGDDVANARRELWQEGNSTRLDTNTQEWTHSKLHNQSSCEGFIPNANRTQREGKCKSIRIHQERTDTSKYSWWEAESCVGRVVDGMADWSHQLKALGNGQVPLQAALAWKLLA